jgi:hypothetical protein
MNTTKNETLNELTAAINALPVHYRTQMAPILVRLEERDSRRVRILQLVQDALQQLRLDMKYLAFDLEATRRERDTAIAKLGAK